MKISSDERIILRIMASHIIGDDKVPPHSRQWLLGLERLGLVELIGGRVWAITPAGRAALTEESGAAK